jgi:hypothetical protein
MPTVVNILMTILLAVIPSPGRNAPRPAAPAKKRAKTSNHSRGTERSQATDTVVVKQEVIALEPLNSFVTLISKRNGSQKKWTLNFIVHEGI